MYLFHPVRTLLSELLENVEGTYYSGVFARHFGYLTGWHVSVCVVCVWNQ